MEGPADRAALLETVESAIPGAYSSNPRARGEAFKRDKRRLREFLRADLAYADGMYELREPGPFFSVPLSPQSLEAMVTLALTFEGNVDYVHVRRFLEEIARLLPPERGVSLENPQSIINYEILQHIDPNHIPQQVWEIVRRAKLTRRELEFEWPLSSLRD